jgi:hypothetical protein
MTYTKMKKKERRERESERYLDGKDNIISMRRESIDADTNV